MLAASEAKHNIRDQNRLAVAAHQAKNAAIVQTFDKRASEAPLAAGATPEAAEAASTAAATDAEIAFEQNAM